MDEYGSRSFSQERFFFLPAVVQYAVQSSRTSEMYDNETTGRVVVFTVSFATKQQSLYFQ